MANIDLTAGEIYRFGRIKEETVIIDSTDHSHATKVFGNSVIVSGSNVGSPAFQVRLISNGDVHFNRPSGTGTTPLLDLTSNDATGHCGVKWDGQNPWTVGTFNDSTAAERDFQIRDSVVLSTAPRTNANVGLSIGPKNSSVMPIFMPNIDDDAGNHPVRYNTTTREITYNSSTRRTKKDIENAPSSLFNKILHLPLRQFKKRNAKSNETIYIGFIAEEAAAVDPSFASYGADYDYNENGVRGELLSDEKVPVNIDLTAMVTALIGKVKQLETRIYQLENK